MSDSRLRVLVVDDEPAVRRFLHISLASQGYQVNLAGNGQDAVSECAAFRPDLIILDLGLPDLDGVDVLRLLRERTLAPVIVVSVRDQESEKVRALDAGADDYVTKPFGTKELMARMRVVMRRPLQAGSEPVFINEGLAVDLARRLVTVDGEEVQLTPTEYDLLRALIAHPGKVFTHNQLMQRVWGQSHENDSHLLRVNISNLRHKLEKDSARPRYIITEAGVGYRLRMPA
jgi:two-component system, OmpR family, KDP operon response regulator KdpE